MEKNTLEEREESFIIPHEIRNELNLKPGQEYSFVLISGSKKIENNIDKFVAKTQLSIQEIVFERRDDVVFLRPSMDMKQFCAELKGCVKRSKIKSNEIKTIWKM